MIKKINTENGLCYSIMFDEHTGLDEVLMIKEALIDVCTIIANDKNASGQNSALYGIAMLLKQMQLDYYQLQDVEDAIFLDNGNGEKAGCNERR